MAAPLAPLTLLDLPDDMLNVIASAINEPAAHVALLGTCKRLRDAVYEAPCSLVVRTPSNAGWRVRRRRHFAALAKRGTGRSAARALVEFPTETAAAAAHLLASVVRFLSTHKQVRSLTLYSSPNGAVTMKPVAVVLTACTIDGIPTAAQATPPPYPTAQHSLGDEAGVPSAPRTSAGPFQQRQGYRSSDEDACSR